MGGRWEELYCKRALTNGRKLVVLQGESEEVIGWYCKGALTGRWEAGRAVLQGESEEVVGLYCKRALTDSGKLAVLQGKGKGVGGQYCKRILTSRQETGRAVLQGKNEGVVELY